jgi:hypothetical protein
MKLSECSSVNTAISIFTKRHNMEISILPTKKQCCPAYCTGDHTAHGDQFIVRLRRREPVEGQPTTLQFFYWNTYQDKLQGERPHKLFIISYLSWTQSGAWMQYSKAQSVEAALEKRAFKERITAFFTAPELNDLAEVAAWDV